MSASGQFCDMFHSALIVYPLVNKKQLGHPRWLLADCYLAPWTLPCFPFALALVFIQSMKSQTLTTGTGLQLWLPCPILYTVVLRKAHGEGTELLCFNKSLAFPFICLITRFFLSFWPTNHSWLKQLGKCDPLSQLLLLLLVFRALPYIWHGNCIILQQGETSISANCHSRSYLKLDSFQIIFMIKY